MTILIPNFTEFLHYGNRTAPWIKLHKKVLQDHTFMSLPPKDQMLLLGLRLLAAEFPLEEGCGVLRMSMDELAFHLPVEALKGKPRDPFARLKLAGFVVVREESVDEARHA
jgi:hypothetical protein